MITYETLEELAHALSKVSGYRYVAFNELNMGDLVISFSDSEMSWHEQKIPPYGVLVGELDCGVLPTKNLSDLDWSKCQFDCKEEEEW